MPFVQVGTPLLLPLITKGVDYILILLSQEAAYYRSFYLFFMNMSPISLNMSLVVTGSSLRKTSHGIALCLQGSTVISHVVIVNHSTIGRKFTRQGITLKFVTSIRGLGHFCQALHVAMQFGLYLHHITV